MDAGLEEILCSENISTPRRWLAQEVVERAKKLLWQTELPRCEVDGRAEEAIKTYRKVIEHTQWRDFNDTSLKLVAAAEAETRKEAYIATLAFQGCELEIDELPLQNPLTFKSLPRDLYEEEKLIISALQIRYGDTEPASDLA